MEQTFEEFKQAVHTKKERDFKVRGSWGVYDVYKHLRKDGWKDIGQPVKEEDFYNIIRSVNKLLAEEIAKGETVKFPERMGCLELRKYEVGAFMVDGKLKVTYPIDWQNTLKLWYEDDEAHKQKLFMRQQNKWVYHVKYCLHDANYENKKFYLFALNTKIKKALSRNIKQGKTDTLYG